MIIKSWKFKGFTSDIPEWVQQETSKRAGHPDIWVHTQRGEEPAHTGQWISVSLRGHIDIHNEKPIRPRIGVKMKKFLMHMSFGPIADDGPVVMRSMDIAIKLSAFVLVRVNEAESLAFSDFEYAG